MSLLWGIRRTGPAEVQNTPLETYNVHSCIYSYIQSSVPPTILYLVLPILRTQDILKPIPDFAGCICHQGWGFFRGHITACHFLDLGWYLICFPLYKNLFFPASIVMWKNCFCFFDKLNWSGIIWSTAQPGSTSSWRSKDRFTMRKTIGQNLCSLGHLHSKRIKPPSWPGHLGHLFLLKKSHFCKCSGV